jgi:hypothetical protein
MHHYQNLGDLSIMKTRLICFIVLSISILASSCASYKAHSLSYLSPQTAPFSEQKEGIAVSCKAFTKKDCKQYFDRDVIAKGFQPIQLTIENNTKRHLFFSKNNISLPCANPEYVADTVHTSTVGRATAYGVGALFLWPLAVPAIVDGIKSSNANEALDNDFAGKSPAEQMISPFSHFNGVIFVPVEFYQELFTITLVDKETNEMIPYTLRAVRN